MLNISALSQFDFYKNFTLIAGKNGMTNPISNVVILEYESSLRDYSGFSEGNLVLTSLFFAKDDASLIEEAFMELIKKGVSGFAVKTAYYTELPAQILKLADEKNIPLFLFHDVYMEDIIIGVNRLTEESERSDFYEEQLHALIAPSDRSISCKQLLSQINPAFTVFLTALYLEPSQDLMRNRIFYNQMIYQKNKLPDFQRIFITRYYQGYLFLFHHEKECNIAEAKSFMLRTLQALELLETAPAYALCPICHTPEHFDELLMKCFYTDIARRLLDKTELSYEELGIHKMLLPSLVKEETSLFFEEKLALLQEYDAAKRGFLLPTLLSYVDNDMQINATANALFQHPNTVRYRLEKTKELLSADNSFSFSILATFLVELYRLKQISLPYPI